MSVTIKWRPVTDEGRAIVGGTSDCLNKLQDIFHGVIPGGEMSVNVLRAMHTATGNEFYDAVADIVERHGAIKFWGEW